MKFCYFYELNYHQILISVFDDSEFHCFSLRLLNLFFLTINLLILLRKLIIAGSILESSLALT